MENVTTALGGDHARCDDLFARAEASVSAGDWEEADTAFAAFAEAMDHHFRMEEEVLFPTFEETTGQNMGPTQIMRMEHGQMRRLFAEMEDSLAGRDRDEYLGQAETLLMIMQQHNAKEEQILYRMADQVLAPQMDTLLERMREV